MVRLLGERNFSSLWWGGLVSMLGNSMLVVALPVYIYRETDSTLATSLMFVASTLPRILFGSVVGVFVDRLEHKRTMVVCNLVLAVTLCPILLDFGSETVWLIYIVAFLQSSINLFFGPAENAFLPSLVARDELVSANAMNALNNNLARLIGPAVGGLIVSRFGLAGVVMFDLASYLTAAALIACIRDRAEPNHESLGVRCDLTSQGALKGWSFQWREGLAQVRSNGVLKTVLYTMTLAAFGEGTFSVLFAPFVSEAFAGGALEFGWVMSAQAVGGVLGGVLIGWLRPLAPGRLFALGLFYIGLIDLVMFNIAGLASSLIPLLGFMVIVGLPATAIGAGYTTSLQTSLEARFLGRVFSLVDTVSALALLLGIITAGILGDLIGVMTLIKVQGGAHVVGGLLAFVLLKPSPKPAAVRRL